MLHTNLKAEAKAFDMEACLVNLAQRQIDLEDEEAELTNQVAALVSCHKGRTVEKRPLINQLQDDIEARMCHLRYTKIPSLWGKQD